MMTDVGAVAAGLVGGLVAIRERQVRRTAERFAAATFETLLEAIDANDADTGAHVRRVAAYSLILTDAVGLDDRMTRSIERVALFHDIGKIHSAIYDIVHDDARLSPEEWKLVATHPRRGADVLAPLCPFYPDLADGVLSHHECWDGSGYPRKLSGNRIPLQARIVAIADTYDAITHSRRYRGGRSSRRAAEIIANGRGTQFDPELVDLFLFPPVFDEIEKADREFRLKWRGHGQRRGGRVSFTVPDISFRWRRPGIARPLRGQER